MMEMAGDCTVKTNNFIFWVILFRYLRIGFFQSTYFHYHRFQSIILLLKFSDTIRHQIKWTHSVGRYNQKKNDHDFFNDEVFCKFMRNT